ncbi:MAG: hypothetical protein ACRDIB_15765 [Ardenticatenaceae bacterium]
MVRAYALCSLLLLALSLTACIPTRTYTVASQPEAVRPSRALSQRPLRQTFVVPAAGLREIEVVLVVPRSAPVFAQRPLQWRVHDHEGRTVGEGTVETASFEHNTPLRLRLRPVPPGEVIELALTAPPQAKLALWTSDKDQYLQGTIIANAPHNGVDLQFTLRASETPLTLLQALIEVAERWSRGAWWIPLLLVTPGWLLAWVLRPGGDRPILPYVAGLSLALAPLVYLWTSIIGLRLYEPLVQSLFQAAALVLLLLMLRNPQRVREACHTPWRGALALLGVLILLGMATWLLAARDMLAPVGAQAPALQALAQALVSDGVLSTISAPLPPAVLAATLTQMSREPLANQLILGGLLIGLSLVPALYALASEVSQHPWASLWVVPLAWLWPAPWQALARGELSVLYGIALLPIVVALGLRGLRVAERSLQTILLAAVPLAALALVQGALVLQAWLLTLVIASIAGREPAPGAEGDTYDLRAVAEIILRGLLWLIVAGLLWLPALLRGAPLLLAQVTWLNGYVLLLVALFIAAVTGWLAPRSRPMTFALTLFTLLLLPLLFWWRSAPVG